MFIRQLLVYERSYVYIHIDAKSLDMIPNILKSERVTVLPDHYDVKWGDYTQILVYNYLLSYATLKRQHSYYSLHSGVDMAIRPVNELIAFLKDTNCYGYYGCSKLPNGWQYGGGLGRLALYWPKFFRKRLSAHSPMRYLRSLYGRLYGVGIIKGKKLSSEYPLYGGADWFTVREDCVNDMFTFLESHPDFQEMFVDSLSGAEIYYVTLFEMLKDGRIAQNRNTLRYIDWKERGQKCSVGAPNTCSMDFLQEIEMSNCFFARKFDFHYDSEIVEYYLNKCGVGISD